jgi:hypothetical protein
MENNMDTKTIAARLALMLSVGVLVMASGCSTVSRNTPTAPAQVQLNMESGNCQLLEKTMGTSTKTSILGGLVSVIDGDKVSILGIKFFEDQYTIQDSGWLSKIMPVPVADRAYYKALAATPDADAVACKAFTKRVSGVPLIFTSQEVTYQGKAFKFQSVVNGQVVK